MSSCRNVHKFGRCLGSKMSIRHLYKGRSLGYILALSVERDGREATLGSDETCPAMWTMNLAGGSYDFSTGLNAELSVKKMPW